MAKQTAANNAFLAKVKKGFNAPTYKLTLELANTKGEQAAREYVQSFVRSPVDEALDSLCAAIERARHLA
jgi:hypothetical protein